MYFVCIWYVCIYVHDCIAFFAVFRDRKRKRFVGQTGKEANVKKIKTESGQWIAASYKSRSYQQWRERHKMEALQAGEEEDSSTRPSTSGEITD